MSVLCRNRQTPFPVNSRVKLVWQPADRSPNKTSMRMKDQYNDFFKNAPGR